MMLTIKDSSPIRAMVTAAVATLVALLFAPPAGAAEPAAPQLSISIDNGRTSAEVGDQLSYSITVENLGPDAVKRLLITQTMPPGLTADSADTDGVVKPEQVTWRVNLKAADTKTLVAKATVSKTSKQTLRLAAVVCASTGAEAPPIVCASHSDQLAAGAAAEAAAKAAAKPDDDGMPWAWLTAGTAAVLLAGLLIARRRLSPGRRRAETKPDPTPERAKENA